MQNKKSCESKTLWTWLLFSALVVLIALLCTACSAQAEFDIRGTWDYTMLAQDENVYDTGTITFSGKPAKGTYRQLNIYDVEYEGEYTVNGTTIKLTGDETWQGTVLDATQMKGTWVHEGEASGTWTAVKSSP